MAQHDYDVANAAGAAVRADINTALLAIVSNNSGTTAPATMFAYQYWADTTADLLKQRNAANTAWVNLLTLSTGKAATAVLADTATTVAGTTTNDNAAAGKVGEYVEGFFSSAAMTDNVSINATSISLTAGDWDVSAIASFTPEATTSVTQFISGISTVSSTLQNNRYVQQRVAAYVPGFFQLTQVVPKVRLSLASTTTIYLVQSARFTISTMTTGSAPVGGLFARRVR